LSNDSVYRRNFAVRKPAGSSADAIADRIGAL
jgi:hypothetical protein